MGETTAQRPSAPSQELTLLAKVFIAATTVCGAGVLLEAWLAWPESNWLRFGFYAAVACLSAGWKIRFPGVEATLSVNFFFNLLVAVELGFSEGVALATLSVLVQMYWRAERRPDAVQIPFNTSLVALSCGAAAHEFALSGAWGLDFMPRMAFAAAAQFCTNMVLVSMVITLTQGRKLLPTLKSLFWLFPYYFVGALAVAGFHALNLWIGWQSALLTLPAGYVAYRSFRIYMDRVDAERRHSQQMSALQMRTIEALALAIECKDETTHEHLGRVQVYAIEVAKELGLGEGDMEALRAASLLHDIGKLAVPESILNKPGRLTPEEFAKMKIHPAVGAEILSSVQFPYPVVPFVRSHHEKWDGSGYPDGLKGEEIPVGSRIIAAVDCLDALASDRQYRRALPLEKAMDIVRDESGRAFDPRIVDILSRRYVEFERMAKQYSSTMQPKLSLAVTVERGGAPGAGYEKSSPTHVGSLVALARADNRQVRLETLIDTIRATGEQLGYAESMAVVAFRLADVIPYDGFAAYQLSGRTLEPVCVTGEDAGLFRTTPILRGQGVSGWVAEHGTPIVNGNSSVEPGDLIKKSKLRSALSVPVILEPGGIYGVVTLHSMNPDAFSSQDASALAEVCGEIAKSACQSRLAANLAAAQR